MNLRFVEAFYWVATLQSVTQAAEKLHLTQSAMSSRIAALEADLGMQLLDRSLRKVRLTVAGTRFLGHARSMLELMREARLQNRSLASRSAPLRLGAIESVMQAWLISWIPEVGGEYPGLSIEFTIDTTSVLQELMNRGALDIVFATLPTTCEGVRVRPLPSQDTVLVANPERYPRSSYSLADLAGAEFMTSHRGSHSHFALLDLFRQHRLVPGLVHALASQSVMVQLAADGFGIAVMAKSAALGLLPDPCLRILTTTVELLPISMFASYRGDGATQTTENVVRSALAFIASRESMQNPLQNPLPAARLPLPDGIETSTPSSSPTLRSGGAAGPSPASHPAGS